MRFAHVDFIQGREYLTNSHCRLENDSFFPFSLQLFYINSTVPSLVDDNACICSSELSLELPCSLGLISLIQRFSLITNQPIVFLVMTYQPSEQGAYEEGTAHWGLYIY
jgi:uncharacterized protein YchJ